MNASTFIRSTFAALTLALVGSQSAHAQQPSLYRPYGSTTAYYPTTAAGNYYNSGYGTTGYGQPIQAGGCRQPGGVNGSAYWPNNTQSSAYRPNQYQTSAYYNETFQPAVNRPYNLMIDPSLSTYGQWNQTGYPTSSLNNGSQWGHHHHQQFQQNGALQSGYSGQFNANYR
jgi:hypothetical protein